MGFLNKLEGLAGGGSQSDQGKVLGGFTQALEQHPGGIQGIIDSFRNNGLGKHATAFSNGETPSMTPSEVEQGFNGTGLIERTAQNAGVSPQVAQMAMATVLPMVMAHFASNPDAGNGPGGISGIAKQLMGRFL